LIRISEAICIGMIISSVVFIFYSCGLTAPMQW
jgi:hypothetical protein